MKHKFTLLIVILFVLLSVTGAAFAEAPERITMCNPGGNPVEVRVDQVEDKLQHGWTMPDENGECPDGEDDDDDDGEEPVICEIGFHLVGEECVPDDGDDEDPECADNETLINGVCVPDEDDDDDDDPECAEGEILVEGVCVPDDGDEEEPETPVTPRRNTVSVNRSVPAFQVEAWSELTETSYWQVLINGTWHWVTDEDGVLLTSNIEWRWRMNQGTGEYEMASLTRMVFDNSLPADPRFYRTVDPNSGLLTGVWFSISDEWCNEFNICGVSDFRGMPAERN